MSTVTIPIRTYSALNTRVHWAKRAKRAKAERQTAYLLTPSLWQPPCAVTLTRIAPRRLDGDNLQGAMKNLRDGVADSLGVDDADERVAWYYRQEKGKDYAVRIELSDMASAALDEITRISQEAGIYE